MSSTNNNNNNKNDNDDMLPPAIRLHNRIKIKFSDPLEQQRYVNGYLLGLIGALYEDSRDVRVFMDRLLEESAK